MVIPLSPYVERSIRFERVVERDAWRIKLYRMHHIPGCPIDATMLNEACDVFFNSLRERAESAVIAGVDWTKLPTYGVGFAMVHVGKDAVFAILDYWTGENMLNHKVWVKPLAGNKPFVSLHSTSLSVCVWELAVQAHEREAWIKHVYNPAQNPNLDDYLLDVMNADL